MFSCLIWILGLKIKENIMKFGIDNPQFFKKVWHKFIYNTELTRGWNCKLFSWKDVNPIHLFTWHFSFYCVLKIYIPFHKIILEDCNETWRVTFCCMFVRIQFSKTSDREIIETNSKLFYFKQSFQRVCKTSFIELDIEG